MKAQQIVDEVSRQENLKDDLNRVLSGYDNKVKTEGQYKVYFYICYLTGFVIDDISIIADKYDAIYHIETLQNDKRVKVLFNLN